MNESIFHAWHPAQEKGQMEIPFTQKTENPLDDSSGMATLSRQQRNILTALMAAGDAGMTNVELAHPSICGLRFGGRIHELRAAWLPEHGYEVEVSIPDAKDRPGLRIYRLVKRTA